MKHANKPARVLLGTCLAVALLAATATAQNDHINNITVAKHVDTATDGNAAVKYTSATNDLKTDNGTCADVACCVTLNKSGATGSFGTTGDGLDVITSNAELNTVFAVAKWAEVYFFCYLVQVGLSFEVGSDVIDCFSNSIKI